MPRVADDLEPELGAVLAAPATAASVTAGGAPAFAAGGTPAALARLAPPQRAQAVLAMQRGHGNAAVARTLQARGQAPSLHREARAGERCACGGTIGLDGMCDKCRAEREASGSGAAEPVLARKPLEEETAAPAPKAAAEPCACGPDGPCECGTHAEAPAPAPETEAPEPQPDEVRAAHDFPLASPEPAASAIAATEAARDALPAPEPVANAPPAPAAPPETTSTPAAGAPSGAAASGAAAAQPAAAMAGAGSTTEVLSALEGAPASAFGAALGAASATTATIKSTEKAELAAHPPEVAQPTGMPPGQKPMWPETAQAASAAPELPAGGARAEPPAERPVEARGPVPGSTVSTAAREPAAQSGDEGGSSWWSWLTDRVRGFVSSLPTSDPGLVTAAGPAPRVDLTGDAAPDRATTLASEAGGTVGQERAGADAGTSTDFGENAIRPTVKPETLTAPTAAAAAGGAGGPGAAPAAAGASALPPEAQGPFDSSLAPWIRAEVAQRAAPHREQVATYEQSKTDAEAEGRRKIAEEDAKTRAEQEQLTAAARTEVGEGKSRWREENRKIEATFGRDAAVKRTETAGKITSTVGDAHSAAGAKLEQAETKAGEEKARAEQEAAAKRSEAEAKPRGFWESAKGAVTSVFEGIRSTVTGIFDAVRETVKGIIETAKAAARDLIDTARNAVVGLIEGFGAAVKGFVDVALAAFPETAARAKAWIDARVTQATEAVDRAAETLKRGVEALLDGIAGAIDAALDLMHQGVDTILAGMQAVATAPFEAAAAMERLYAALARFAPLPEGLQLFLDRLKTIYAAAQALFGPTLAAAIEPLAPGAGALLGGGPVAAVAGAAGMAAQGAPAAASSASSLPDMPDLSGAAATSALPIGGLGGLSGGFPGGKTPSPKIDPFDAEKGGGCGFCYGEGKPGGVGPREAGNEAHRRIQAQFCMENGGACINANVAPVGAPKLLPDLVIRSPAGGNRIEIGEIKSAHDAGMDAGLDKLLNLYGPGLRALCPNCEIVLMQAPRRSVKGQPLKFPTLSPNCPEDQNLFVAGPIGGLFSYFCEPGYAALAAKGCKCKEEDPDGPKVPVPNPQEEKKKQEDEKKKKEKEKDKDTQPDADPVPEGAYAWAKKNWMTVLAIVLGAGVLAAVISLILWPEPIGKAVSAALAAVAALAFVAVVVAMPDPTMPDGGTSVA